MAVSSFQDMEQKPCEAVQVGNSLPLSTQFSRHSSQDALAAFKLVSRTKQTGTEKIPSSMYICAVQKHRLTLLQSRVNLSSSQFQVTTIDSPSAPCCNPQGMQVPASSFIQRQALAHQPHSSACVSLNIQCGQLVCTC